MKKEKKGNQKKYKPYDRLGAGQTDKERDP